MRLNYLFILVAVGSFIVAQPVDAVSPRSFHGGDKTMPARACPVDENPVSPWKTVGCSVERRPIRAVTRGDGAEAVLLMGAFHGGERLTGPFVERFDAEVASKPGAVSHKRRVIIVPYVNPDGWTANTRVNARGVDINRNFPTRNWRPKPTHYSFPPGPRPASEPETRVVMELIESNDPVLIVSVHSPLNMINYDGPARITARKMGEIAKMRVRRYVGYYTPGSLGAYAGRERRIPTITLELPDGRNMDDFWPPVSKALLFAINQ